MTSGNLHKVYCFLWFFYIAIGVSMQDINAPGPYHQYCIIGAGPSGIQMAYFLQKANRDYIVYEQNSISGSFFVKYPRHRTLISINKRFTGQTNNEFNLRHDWNSLISDDESLTFTKYSNEFFPHADDMITYLNDFTRKFNLHIQYNTKVQNVSTSFVHKDFSDSPNKVYSKASKEKYPHYFASDTELPHRFTFRDQNGKSYTCGVMLVGTGWSKPFIPDDMIDDENLLTGYEDMSLDPKFYTNKAVMILGKGNSGFESAQHISNEVSSIHLVGESRIALAWQTHYVGDLRAVNLGLIDTYQLKSLTGVLEATLADIEFYSRSKDSRICLKTNTSFAYVFTLDNFPARDCYDVVIRCLGFIFDFEMFDESTRPKPFGKIRKKAKLPLISSKYSSMPGMYMIGPLAHSLDHRKASGGFIHGFRYTTRALSRLLEFEFHSVVWPSITSNINHLENHIVKRINDMSGPYQMFGVLGEVILIDTINNSFTHLEEFPIKLLDRLEESTGHIIGGQTILVITLEYGADYSGIGKDVFQRSRIKGSFPHDAWQSNFLHPVFYHYKILPSRLQMKNIPKKMTLPVPDGIMMLSEDFNTEWNTPKTHILQLRRWLEMILGGDRRRFFVDSCFQMALVNDKLPTGCYEYPTNHHVWLHRAMV